VKELFKSSKGKYIAPAPIENLLNADGHVEMSCITGAGLAQPVALVLLAETLRKGLRSQAVDRAAVDASLAKLLELVNGQVQEWERLGCLVVVRDEWQIENGFLTPTMKIRRAAIDDRYGRELEGWSRAGQKVVWQAEG
jgi:long-subunit acyl-CoA synthetase (AMP-forming)